MYHNDIYDFPLSLYIFLLYRKIGDKKEDQQIHNVLFQKERKKCMSSFF